MKKSKWLDCQGNEFFPKLKGTPSLVKIEHKNTATLDSARSKKNIKSQFCNYILMRNYHDYKCSKIPCCCVMKSDPASRHLQCGIVDIKTKHEFGNGTSGAGFMLCYYYYYYYYHIKINLERKYFL